MSKLKKILIGCLCACCAIASLGAIAACGGAPNYKSGTSTDNGEYDKNNPNGDLPFYYPEGTDPSDYEDPSNIYIIHTTSLGGLAINGVKITVSKDNVTIVEGRSANGAIKFGLPEGEYDLGYSDLPNGYFVDSEATLYKLGEKHEVTTAFASAVIHSAVPGGYYYDLGDVAYDFGINDTEGNQIVLSELLKEKKLVVLNFWYTTCTFCLQEFPAINQAYNAYKDDVEIIAIASKSMDTPNSVKNFKNTFTYDDTADSGTVTTKKLDFPMAYDSIQIIDHFNIAGYPTSIFIDRYGVIAYAEPQAQTSPNVWIENFARFTADDYKQSTDMGSLGGGDQSATEAVPPPSDIAPLPSDTALTEALVAPSMLQGANAYGDLPLHFRGPDPDIEEEANAAMHSWPFHIGQDDGLYIRPSNIGDGTNNTLSILYTNVVLEANQTLSVEIKLNTESNNDILYIYMNRSTDNYYSGSGNSGGWKKETLYAASRHTELELLIAYVKNNLVTQEDEFVGLRNLKIETIDENVDAALDIRTEAAEEIGGVMRYKSVYLGDDGFYRVYTKDNQKLASDPLLMVDVLYETLWSDKHLPDFTLVSFDEVKRIKSVYNICYWLFNKSVQSDQDDATYNNNLIFGDMGETNSGSIIDSYYIQSTSISLVPVSVKVRAALEKFVEVAVTQSDLRDYYKGGANENTWLELCSYYRMTGKGSHTADGHTCLGTTNPGEGRILEYAIPLYEGDYSIKSADYTMKNRDGGLFYKFTAEKAGVYKFESLYEYKEGDPLDPKILIWGSVNDDAFKGDKPIAQADETMSADRMKTKTNNFKLFIYLEKDQTVYPQLTTGNTDYMDVYDIRISYIGATHHELQIATTGEGMWTYYVIDDKSDTFGSLYYIAVPTIYDPSDGLYYHRVGDGVNTEYRQGSVMYIDFLMSNFIDENGNSLEDYIFSGAFDFSESLGLDFTGEMTQYYYRAIAKDKSDPTYGMIEADKNLVEMLTVFTQIYQDSENTVESGIWKAFAYYWQYYGPEEWVDLP